MANRVEDLPLFQKVLAFCSAVTAILNGARLRSDRSLWDQINDANDSIPSNMQEGFEQSTDTAFAKYVYISKGSVAEVVARLQRAYAKKYITRAELDPTVAAGNELGRMMGGFIRYLARSNFKNRGRHNLNNPGNTDSESDGTPE